MGFKQNLSPFIPFAGVFPFLLVYFTAFYTVSKPHQLGTLLTDTDELSSSCVSAPQKEEDFGGFGVSDGNTRRTSQDCENG